MEFVRRDHRDLALEARLIRPLAQMGETEVRAACAALRAVDAAAADDPNITKRLAVRNDGGAVRFGFAIEFPSFHLPEPERPWISNGFNDPLAVSTQFEDLATGLAILRSPTSPTIELERRRAAVAKYHSDREAAAQARQAREQQEADEAAARTKHRESLDPKGWERLQPWQKALFRQAIAVEEVAAANSGETRAALFELSQKFRAIAYDISADPSRGPAMSVDRPWKRAT